MQELKEKENLRQRARVSMMAAKNPTKTFLFDRRNALFLSGVAEPSVRPEFARLLHTPRAALKLLRGGHWIRATLAVLSGVSQFILLGLFVLGVFGFLVCLAFFMSGIFITFVEAGRRMAGMGPSSDDFYLPILAVAWAVALTFNLIWGSAGFRRSLPMVAAGLRLAKIGTVLAGQVVSCQSSSRLQHNGWNDELICSFALSYSFVTPAGKKLSAWVVELPVRPTKGWNPEPGDPLTILYADDENFQVL